MFCKDFFFLKKTKFGSLTWSSLQHEHLFQAAGFLAASARRAETLLFLESCRVVGTSHCNNTHTLEGGPTSAVNATNDTE